MATRRIFFLDASALVHRYAFADSTAESRTIRLRLDRLFTAASESSGDVILQIPNICMAECASAFARLCFEAKGVGSGSAAEDAFRHLRTALLNDVQRDRLIFSYELKRVHFAGIEDIFRKDYELPAPRRGSRLSASDAPIISMAKEYGSAHSGSVVRIVTNDRRISDFCRANAADFPAAVHISTQRPV